MLGILLSTILGLGQLHDVGYRGEGVTVAVIDCGFYHANQKRNFPQDQILGTYDLIEDSIAKTDMFESTEDTHGAMCLSTMLYQNESFSGTAPDANYILIRTEDVLREYIGEVERLIRGMQLADELGANVVTISLGYNLFDDSRFDCRYEDMDGQSRVSQMATTLARHNRIVCVAAGNEGDKDWRHITWPADADSILTVGAVDSLGNLASFSSVGPTADGRIKPEVCAWGKKTWVYSPTKEKLEQSNGTSFATPEVAGMVASLWSAMPHLTAMELRERILQSCDQYTNPDNLRGYGIPDAWSIYNKYVTEIQSQTMSRKCRKELRDGRLVIVTENGEYSVMGEKL